MGTRPCVHHLSIKFWHRRTIRGFVESTTDVFCLCSVSFKVFIPSQRQMRTRYYVCRCLLKCVANHIISPHGYGQKADRCDPVPRPFPPEPALSFPSPSYRPFAPSSPATETLMMSLTHNPSVGNYNICRHEKAAHKDGSSTGCNSSSPLIMSGFRIAEEGVWGVGGWCRVVGVVWEEGEGVTTLCS